MLTGEAVERIERELGSYGDDSAKRPRLRPDLVPVWDAWQQFGVPSQIEGGGMASPTLRDLRASLYPARAQWLDRNTEAGEREVYETCWAALDAEQIAYTAERLDEVLKK